VYFSGDDHPVEQVQSTLAAADMGKKEPRLLLDHKVVGKRSTLVVPARGPAH